MIIKRIWVKEKRTKKFKYTYEVTGIFLFGIIPVYMNYKPISTEKRYM